MLVRVQSAQPVILFSELVRNRRLQPFISSSTLLKRADVRWARSITGLCRPCKSVTRVRFPPGPPVNRLANLCVAQSGRALALGARCRGLESLHTDQYAVLAQLARAQSRVPIVVDWTCLVSKRDYSPSSVRIRHSAPIISLIAFHDSCLSVKMKTLTLFWSMTAFIFA